MHSFAPADSDFPFYAPATMPLPGQHQALPIRLKSSPLAVGPIQEVFSTPEVVGEIVRQVAMINPPIRIDGRLIFPPLLPERFHRLATIAPNWTDPVFSHLWKARVPLHTLMTIAPEHRSYFARKMRQVEVRLPQELTALIPALGVKLINLRALEIGWDQNLYDTPGQEVQGQLSVDDWAPTLLGPKLQQLTIYNPAVAMADMRLPHRMGQLCPSLRHFEIFLEDRDYSTASVLVAGMLEVLPRLESLTISTVSIEDEQILFCQARHTERRRLLLALATHPCLESLSVWTDLPELGELQYILKRPDETYFPRLVHLSSTLASYITLQSLQSIAPSVEEVDLLIESGWADVEWYPDADNIMSTGLPLLKNLQSLILTFESQDAFRNADLRILGSLPNTLHRLHPGYPIDYLDPAEQSAGPSAGVTDEVLSVIGDGLPALKDLSLSICTTVSIEAVRNLGQKCTQLQHLKLLFELNVTAFESASLEPAFPELQTLVVLLFAEGAVNRFNFLRVLLHTPDTTFAAIKRQFPKLRHIRPNVAPWLEKTLSERLRK